MPHVYRWALSHTCSPPTTPKDIFIFSLSLTQYTAKAVITH